MIPEPAASILRSALVAEFTVIDASGRPITHPMIPLCDGERVYVTSSVLFSRKLDHVRRNPKVAIAVTDPAAVSIEPFHRVTVQGDAILDEADPHRGWERVLPLWVAKEPAVEAFLKQRVALPLFWERAVIEIVPRRVWVWEGGATYLRPSVHELVTA